MKTAVDLNAITIDGEKLKQAREARNLSISEIAAAVTLSRDQIKHIEDGGERPFYTPAHKLLAVRKYAAALDLSYDEVVSGPGATQTIPVPEDAPESMLSPEEAPAPADLRLAAVERNAEIRRLVLMGAVALTIVLAIYAKVRGTQDDAQAPEPTAQAATVAPSAQAAPVAAAPAEAATPAAAVPAAAAPTPVAAESARSTDDIKRVAADDPKKTVADNGESCQIKTAGEIRTWSPPYQRKPDTRLFVISPKSGTTVCIADATGKSRLFTLKAMSGQAFAGKPPYTVRSDNLATMEIYLQGLRVRVPADAESLRLVPTQVTAPTGTEPDA